MSKRPTRKAVRDLRKRWPDKVVPYVISKNSHFSRHDIRVIHAAIREWQNYTCLHFRPVNHDDINKVVFQGGKGCASHIGMQTGPQKITLAPGCRKKGITIHEIGHAIGFFHEQSRPDRNKYVTILRKNIKEKNLHNFRRYTDAIINTYGVPYDYTSVMHYGSTYFTRNGKTTIQTADKSKQKVIGNRQGMTFQDIHLANLMYRCDASCYPKPSCPRGGFVGKDCRCWCKGTVRNPTIACPRKNTGRKPLTVKPAPPTRKPGSRKPICKGEGFLCRSSAFLGMCKFSIIRKKCRKACGTCNTSDEYFQLVCEDSRKSCSYWASKQLCKKPRTRDIMSRLCPMSCGKCFSTRFWKTKIMKKN